MDVKKNDMKNCVFTICAKNYLAQALSLRESCLKKCNNVDFFIFLSDLKDSTLIPDYVIELDQCWIKDWQQMAFKYNVIEFSTSIKPFCFNKLFNEGYSKVIYLDPDIYVVNNLSPIYEMLNNFSIILSPHYCNIQEKYTGSVTEEELLFVGIYNLGFTAIKNNNVGNQVIRWWCDRLADKCYADHFDALHVDQRWMDFVPAFFPNETFITHHPGINPAIWNLHERFLKLGSNGEYQISYNGSDEFFPLLFFHFSGFDPFNPKILNRRHPKYSIDSFPSFKPLVEEYIEAEYRNYYNEFSKLEYSFNRFDDGVSILPIHRRLFRNFISENDANYNPFISKNEFYNVLNKNGLLCKKKIKRDISSNIKQDNKVLYARLLRFCFYCIYKIIGVRYYSSLLTFLLNFSRFENQSFLLKKN